MIMIMIKVMVIIMIGEGPSNVHHDHHKHHNHHDQCLGSTYKMQGSLSRLEFHQPLCTAGRWLTSGDDHDHDHGHDDDDDHDDDDNYHVYDDDDCADGNDCNGEYW